jgi:hypothetical protein
MLAAAEAWPRRDHEAEWHSWQMQLQRISERVRTVPGVTTRVSLPDSLSNRTPSLHIEWDAAKTGITGTELAKVLLNTEPRIVLAGGTGSRPDKMQSSATVTPWMLMPGEDKIVADRIYEALTRHPEFPNPVLPQGEPVNIAGQWRTTIAFTRGSAQHTLVFEQKGSDLVGTHRGEFVSGDLTGKVVANEVHFHSLQRIEGQTLGYEFTGTLEGERMSGSVGLGEYGSATWEAVRHQYGPPRRKA